MSHAIEHTTQSINNFDIDCYKVGDTVPILSTDQQKYWWKLSSIRVKLQKESLNVDSMVVFVGVIRIRKVTQDKCVYRFIPLNQIVDIEVKYTKEKKPENKTLKWP